jgi:hypothetical protein
MSCEITCSYDPSTNIALMKFCGKPDSFADMDRAIQAHKETWGNRDHKVWVISDIIDLNKGSYRLVSYYARKMHDLRMTRAAMTVMITGNIESKFSAKMYEIVSSAKIAQARNLDEALAIVKLEQAKLGIFITLD